MYVCMYVCMLMYKLTDFNLYMWIIGKLVAV